MKNVGELKNGCTFATDKHEKSEHHYPNYQCDCNENYTRRGNAVVIS